MKNTYLAAIATILYIAFFAAAFAAVSFEIGTHPTRNADAILVEFVEPKPVAKPEPPKRAAKAPHHEHVAKTDNSQQVTGTDEQTRTVNKQALFPTNKGGADAPENAGNPYAREGEKDEAKGTGGGLNPSGTEFLDEGLQGRGLVGDLPLPEYPAGNRGGKVVVRVTVDRMGRVTDAAYEPKGSTTSDNVLVQAALKVARRAKFTESSAFIQGGTITYTFTMK